MYSQNEEEKYIIAACQRPDGRLLDIGAWDPKTFSNSRALIECGWSAVLIEPSPKPLERLLREYANTPKVTVVSAAVTVERDWRTMQVSEDAVSTTEESTAAVWRERGAYYGQMEMPTVALGEVISHFGAFNFVNIDAEGTSATLFFALLATEMFPQCICVEHDGRHVEIGQAASQRGYVQTYVSGENCVFRRGWS